MENTIESIVFPEDMHKWEKLPESRELAELHRRFWLEGDEYWNPCLNLPWQEDADEDDEDESAEEGDDHAIRSGYVLDLDVNVGRSSVWVRKEYIRMYKRCTDHLDTKNTKKKPPSVVITGQPGIGKSYWILYAICRRLTQKKPTMLYRGGPLFLFVKEGVYRLDRDFSCTELRCRVWTLIASDTDEGAVVPPFLAAQDTRCLVIFTSSPKAERWKGLAKTTACVEVIMNPWSRREISKAAPIHGFEANDERLDNMYNDFGPTPRICFDYLEDKAFLDQHEIRISSAISDLSTRRLLEIANKAQKFDMDRESHSIFLVKRRGDLSRRLSSVEPITAVVARKMRNQLGRDTRAERFLLYRSLVNVQGSRRLAGVLYELLALEKLQGQECQLIPMERTPRRGRALPRLNSVHGSSAHPPSRPFDIRGTAIDSYASMPSPIEDNVYYYPESPNQVAVDSFIKVTNGLYQGLYVFQFTIAEEHDIKRGIIDLFPEDSKPSNLQWHFVFVVPPELSKLSCPLHSEVTAFLEPVNFYNMVVDPEPEPQA